MTLRVLIADDEPLARARLRRLLEREPDLTVVDECGDGAAVLTRLRQAAIDLLFLDIELPELSGFELFSAAGGALPATVFVTAYSEYALRAFDVSAVDYLVKPVEGPRLTRAVERARRVLLPGPTRTTFSQRIPVRVAGRIRLVPVAEIESLEAQGNYVALHLGGREELVRETLSALEAKLDPQQFMRVHRSLIVRSDAIAELEPMPSGEYVITLRSGRSLMSGRTYRARLVRFAGL